MHVVIFEDSHWPALAPFSLSRPVFDLLSGATPLLQKQIRHSRPTRLTLWVRPEMEQFCLDEIVPHLNVETHVNRPLDDEPALLINGRSILAAQIERPTEQAVCRIDDDILTAFARYAGLSPADALSRSARWRTLEAFPGMATPGALARSAVDLIYLNEQSLIEDFGHLQLPGEPAPTGPFHQVNPRDIWLGAGARLSPGCVLDASRGPIMIAGGAEIGANAVVQGPCFIGPGSAIAPLANIRGGVSIGPMSKVGGEVSASIILGFSNKGHEGFLGHSYLGQWVNLGAGTTTSNLKNTYGDISLARARGESPTGRKFLGSLIGDHAKTSILTRLMGGTYIGFCSMVATSSHSPRFVPSFTFLTDKGPATYHRAKAIEVARRVMARRQRAWKASDQAMMDFIWQAAPRVEEG